ncbi:MAG: hypothetical protein RBR97_16985 [Bacteroidales bacterium]|nr:hypothetical protein [Bacteroidales bacterium]
MSTLIIKRPKDREKYYDESNFKIYINGKLAVKLGQNDIKEITVEDNIIEIQAKSIAFGGGSTKVEIKLEERTELEIIRIKNSQVPQSIIFLFPFFFLIFIKSEIYWVKSLIIIPVILMLWWIFYWYPKNKDNFIRIAKA